MHVGQKQDQRSNHDADAQAVDESVGKWDEKLQEFANLITQGEYLKVGEEMATHQEKVKEGMLAPSVRR